MPIEIGLQFLELESREFWNVVRCSRMARAVLNSAQSATQSPLLAEDGDKEDLEALEFSHEPPRIVSL